MKRAFLIAAVVAAYSVFEAVLLLCSGLLSYEDPGGSFHGAFLTSQFLFIPGAAALFSRFIQGSHRWAWRTLFILVGGALGVPCACPLG